MSAVFPKVLFKSCNRESQLLEGTNPFDAAFLKVHDWADESSHLRGKEDAWEEVVHAHFILLRHSLLFIESMSAARRQVSDFKSYRNALIEIVCSVLLNLYRSERIDKERCNLRLYIAKNNAIQNNRKERGRVDNIEIRLNGIHAQLAQQSLE